MQNTCIVIPCYNEAGRLPVGDFRGFISQSPCSFYFVNDGSNDGTLDLLRGLEGDFPKKVKLLDLSVNRGKAEAVRQGFLNALATGEFRFIGYMDADLATPLEEIEFLLLSFDPEIKVVIGSRIKRLGAKVERNVLRHYFGRIFATAASVYLGIGVYDSQCGAKIFKAQIARELFARPFVSRWLFDLELLYRLKKKQAAGLSQNIREVPLRAWEEKGASKIQFGDLLKVPYELYKIRKMTNRLSLAGEDIRAKGSKKPATGSESSL